MANLENWQGQWRPSLNIGAVLASIRVLLEEPNHDDGLMSDIVSLRPTFSVEKMICWEYIGNFVFYSPQSTNTIELFSTAKLGSPLSATPCKIQQSGMCLVTTSIKLKQRHPTQFSQRTRWTQLIREFLFEALFRCLLFSWINYLTVSLCYFWA